MHRKRIAFVGVILTLALFMLPASLFAQSKSATWPRYPGAKVNFLWYPSPEMDAIRQTLPKFKEQTGIDVTLTEIPHEEVFKKRYLDAISGAGEFDVYPLQPSVMRNFAASGYIVPLNELWKGPEEVEYNDLFPGVRAMYEYKSKVFALPLYPDVVMLFYNKKMMDAAGQPIPKTFEEYEKVCKAFMKDTNNDGAFDQWGSVLNLKGGDWSTMNNLSLFLYMNKGDWYRGQDGADLPFNDSNKYRPLLNDPKVVEALTYMVKLYKDQVFSPGSINFSYFEAMENFSTLKVPMYIGFADQAPMIVDVNSLVKNDVQVAPIPAWKGVSRTFTGGWGASVSAFSKNKPAAYTFLRYFYGNSENQKALSALGQTPSRASVLSYAPLQKKFVWYKAMGDMLKDCKPIPLLPEWDEFTSKLEPILDEALLGKTTPKEAMDRANAVLDEIMKRAGYYK